MTLRELIVFQSKGICYCHHIRNTAPENISGNGQCLTLLCKLEFVTVAGYVHSSGKLSPVNITEVNLKYGEQLQH